MCADVFFLQMRACCAKQINPQDVREVMSQEATELFKLELKRLIVEESDQDVAPESISDGEPLFGPHATLALDSIDGLQIAMALQLRYGVALTDPKEVRRVMTSINGLASFLLAEQR